MAGAAASAGEPRPHGYPVLSLYAFSAFEQQRFGEAVAAPEMMLKLLPAGDARRAVIERSIRLAQEK